MEIVALVLPLRVGEGVSCWPFVACCIAACRKLVMGYGLDRLGSYHLIKATECGFCGLFLNAGGSASLAQSAKIRDRLDVGGRT